MMGIQTKTEIEALFSQIAKRATAAGVFAKVTLGEGSVVCRALNASEDADYRVSVENGDIWVSLGMIDRWLSGSIEAQLMGSGDKLHELIEDELDDLGVDDPVVTFEHFRSPEMEFVFRSKVPSVDGASPDAETVGTWLLAYEQCFRQLGDMDESDEE